MRYFARYQSDPPLYFMVLPIQSHVIPCITELELCSLLSVIKVSGSGDRHRCRQDETLIKGRTVINEITCSKLILLCPSILVSYRLTENHSVI